MKRHVWKPPLGAKHNWGHRLSQGLVGHWIMNEGGGGVLNDISPYKNTGTLVASPTWVAGRVGGALTFNGTSQYVSIPTVVTTYPFTISAWVNANANQTNEIVSLSQKTSGYNNRFGVELRTIEGNHAAVYAQTTSYSQALSTNTWSTGTWNDVVGVFTSATSRTIYLNAAGATTDTTNLSPTSIDSAAIGALIENTVQLNFSGSIDDVRIYNRALSATEVKQLYLYPFQDILRPTHFGANTSGVATPFWVAAFH